MMYPDRLFKIQTAEFPYEGEQYLYGVINGVAIGILFERKPPIIRLRNETGSNKDISFEEFLELFYHTEEETEEVWEEESDDWDGD